MSRLLLIGVIIKIIIIMEEKTEEEIILMEIMDKIRKVSLKEIIIVKDCLF